MSIPLRPSRFALAALMTAAVTVAPMTAAATTTKTKDKTTKPSPAGKGIGRKAH